MQHFVTWIINNLKFNQNYGGHWGKMTDSVKYFLEFLPQNHVQGSSVVYRTVFTACESGDLTIRSHNLPNNGLTSGTRV